MSGKPMTMAITESPGSANFQPVQSQRSMRKRMLLAPASSAVMPNSSGERLPAEDLAIPAGLAIHH